ncbi:hypothetical protein BDR03DRAFT_843345, partial [Suillus americanus]
STSGDSLNFPKHVWKSVSKYVNSVPAPSGSKTCSNKLFGSCKSKLGNLKGTFLQVQFIKSTSGLTWSDADGVRVSLENQSVWNELVRNHPAAKPFANKGFIRFATINEIM